MKKLAAEAFTYHIVQSSNSNKRQEEGALTSICEVVHYLLDTYATEDGNTEIGAKIFCITQPSNMTPKDHVGTLWNKVIYCDWDYDESVLKGIFIEGLHRSIRCGMKSF